MFPLYIIAQREADDEKTENKGGVLPEYSEAKRRWGEDGNQMWFNEFG